MTGRDDGPSGGDGLSRDGGSSRDTATTGDGGPSGEGNPRVGMERALRQIRREGWKAAIIHAIVDAVAVLLAVNLAVTVLDPPWAPSGVAIPSSAAEVVAEIPGVTGSVSVPGSALLGAGLAAVVFVLEVGVRVRRPLVEQFEAGNPPVAEALRTARDAVERDTDSEMARRLYADVLDRLRETSSVALLDFRRVGVAVVLVLVLSVASVQVAVYDISLDGGGETDVGTNESEESVEFSGLQDGDSVLGESGPVESGDENLTAQVESTRGNEEIDEQEEFPAGGGGGGGSGGNVEGQQAGFTQQEEIEDAELVREYNVRIRDQEN